MQLSPKQGSEMSLLFLFRVALLADTSTETSLATHATHLTSSPGNVATSRAVTPVDVATCVPVLWWQAAPGAKRERKRQTP